MSRRENEEYIIGYISLISNKFVQFGDLIMPDITFRQWFLLLMISRMDQQEKTINSIAEFVGSTRQNVKRMLDSLAKKGYVIIEKSSSDIRALNVRLNQKAFQYFSENDEPLASEMNKLFSAFFEGEIANLAKALEKLLGAFDAYQKEKENNE